MAHRSRPAADALWIRRLALAGLLAFIAALIAEHLLVPGLSPLEHEISEYANARYGTLMTVAFSAWALSFAASAALCLRAPGPRGAVRGLAVLLVIAAVGMALTDAFHTQTSAGKLPAGVTRTRGGEIHNLASGAVLIALALALPVSLAALPADRRLRSLTLTILAGAVPVTVVLLIVGSDGAGIRQRVLVACACTWQLALLGALGTPEHFARKGEGPVIARTGTGALDPPPQ